MPANVTHSPDEENKHYNCKKWQRMLAKMRVECCYGTVQNNISVTYFNVKYRFRKTFNKYSYKYKSGNKSYSGKSTIKSLTLQNQCSTLNLS